MSASIERRLLTGHLLTTLRTIQVNGEALLVGDTVIPPGAAWVGEPNAPGSKFVPYVVLTTLTATCAEGGIGPQADWVMPYAIQSFGVLPEQAQWMADQTRTKLAGLKDVVLTLGPSNYKIAWVGADQLGGVNKITVANTVFYGIQDGVSLSLRKRRS